MMKIHKLKTWPEPFQAIIDGHKTFELRRNDRDFEEGDILDLHEWDPPKVVNKDGVYTGRRCVCYVSHLLESGSGITEALKDGFVCMSIKVVHHDSPTRP